MNKYRKDPKKPNKNVVHTGYGQGKHKAKKSLGQNFLKSVVALREIVKAGELTANDIVLEIGPGKGALTGKLLEVGATVVAVEKDNTLFDFLREKFTQEIQKKKLILLNDDILLFDPIKTLSIPGMDRGYKIIANIPYNITGAILKKFLTDEYQPSLMVLMVQNEVAKRIVARANPKKPNKNVVHTGYGQGKESLLSISVKAYGTPKMIMKVPARYFSPAPKVDSAVISIKDISRKFFNSVSIPGMDSEMCEEKFWKLVHAGFAHKRKQIGKSIKKLVSTEGYEKFKNKRAEDLSLADWIELLK